MIEYKGYIGVVDFDPEIDLFHGTVINTHDVITFYGASVSELREEMQKSIEGYIEFCQEQGKIPEKPFSGEFTVQMSPEMHCKLALNAEQLHLDFSVYLQEILEKAALEDKEKMTNLSELNLVNPKSNAVNHIIDDQPTTDQWTMWRVKDSLPQELIIYYEKTYPEERRKLFYNGVAGVLNLIQKEGWRLNPPKFSKMLCGFWLTDNGVIGRIERIFGVLPSGKFPDPIVGRDGELIKKVQTRPRIFVRITKEEAKQLEREHNGCEYYGVSEAQSADYVYYNIPENTSELFPVLEFAYKKHTGN